MQHRTARDTVFLDWFDSLDDDTRQQVLAELRQMAQRLGVRVHRKPFIAHDRLHFPTHIASEFIPN